MLTGFEALGAASAVLQVISFAGSLTSLCYKIYDGQATSEQDLEAYTAQLIDAVGRVQNRYPLIPQGSSDEKKLAEIAQQCIKAAKALEAETQLVTKLCKRGSLSKALYGAFRAAKHKGKIEQLEKSLQGHKKVMEAHLLLKLCTKSDAMQQQQSKIFPSLEKDVRNLIGQIADGYQKTEDLIRVEQHTTRGLITTEANTSRKEVHDEVRGLGASIFSANQHERFLGSLKVSEMNQRYHDVMDSTDASFERIFLSYDRVTSDDQRELDSTEYDMSEGSISDTSSIYSWSDISEDDLLEIDQAWTTFTSWLISNDQEVFWIRGKPGSGKSTLMKFVVENDNTKHLLASWSPGVKIVSHFFWKIGTSPQNSIKGLLCSLLYSSLDGNAAIIDQVLEQFRASSSKDSYHDWSVRDLETVLFLALKSQTHSTCIFIDGLDELSDKERVLDLKGLIAKLNSYDNIKVCVSSRPETQLLNVFEAMGTKSLRLEDLTRPEMAAYVCKELQTVEADKQMTPTFCKELTDMLLDKAEGVFLWLFLAMKSVISGIQNRDDEEILRQRLHELPRELEELYADMWSRLNAKSSVYRETAERYFNYAIAQRADLKFYFQPSGSPLGLFRLTLAEVALAETPDIHRILTFNFDETTLPDLNSLCKKARNNILARSAGLLQLRNNSLKDLRGTSRPEDFWLSIQEVSFVHRTAHDFLVDTEGGQRILNRKQDTSVRGYMDSRLLKSQLCLAIILHNRFEAVMEVDRVLRSLLDFLYVHGDRQTTESLLPIIQDMYNRGILVTRDQPTLSLRPHFVSLLGRKTSSFDGFIMSFLKSMDSLSVATDVLRDICGSRTRYILLPQLVRAMITLGANSHALGLSLIRVRREFAGFHQSVTAFEMIMRGALNELSSVLFSNIRICVDLIEAMAMTCPNWHRRVLISRTLLQSYTPMDSMLWGWEDSRQNTSQSWVTCEVDLQFLLMRFLAAASALDKSTHTYTLQKLSETLGDPFGRIRHIVRPWSESEGRPCYRIINQKPFRGILDDIFTPEKNRDVKYDDVFSLASLPGNAEMVDIDSEFEALAQEGLLCKSHDLG